MVDSQENFPAPSDKLADIRRAIESGEGFSSIKHVPLYFDVSIATMHNWINQGVIPKAYKIGGEVKFTCILESTLLTMQDWVARKPLSSCRATRVPLRGHLAGTENLQPLNAVIIGN